MRDVPRRSTDASDNKYFARCISKMSSLKAVEFKTNRSRARPQQINGLAAVGYRVTDVVEKARNVGTSDSVKPELLIYNKN